MIDANGGQLVRTLAAGLILWSAAAAAESPRDQLVTAAFADRDKAAAIAHIDRARSGAAQLVAKAPDDQDAAIVEATAMAYHAKLTGNRSEAIAARKRFEVLVARYPRNPEMHVALGAWHVGSVVKLGRFMARAGLGAQKSVGLESLDRAVTLGGNRAMFLGLAGLLRLELDPADPQGIKFTEAASRAMTPTPIDRYLQRAALAVMVPIKAGRNAETQKLAMRLSPLGEVDD